MIKKHNRFYADWRDKRGKRHRKAFLTAAEATAYEEKQKALKTPGKSKAHNEQSPRVPQTRSQTGKQITISERTASSTPAEP